MSIEQLLKDIDNVEEQIRIMKNLQEALGKMDSTERAASVSCMGIWSVYFTYSEVSDMLQRRWDGLHVKLGSLLEAKKAAEITAECLLNSSKGISHE